MKERNGYVSNSSSSSFFVKIRGKWRRTTEIQEEEIQADAKRKIVKMADDYQACIVTRKGVKHQHLFEKESFYLCEKSGCHKLFLYGLDNYAYPVPIKYIKDGDVIQKEFQGV